MTFTPTPLTLNALAHTLMQRYSDGVLAQQYALWILQELTQQSGANLLTAREITLTTSQEKQLEQWLHALIVEHEPLQYLLGWVPFGELKIMVKPPILIPRPETEEWCLQLIDLLSRCNKRQLKILELCTGSGCIAIALAHAFPKASVTAVDINPDALALARTNTAVNKITSINWIESDLFDALDASTTYDLIVANPPYISETEFEELDPSVRNWEDTRALVADDEGLAIIRRICQQAREYLMPSSELNACINGQLWIEIGHRQGTQVREIMQSCGFDRVTIIPDLEGKERVVVGAILSETNN